MTQESSVRSLPAPGRVGVLANLDDVAEQAQAYVRQSKAANTLRAYRADWRDFTAWCTERKLEALPAEPRTVALYLTERAESCRVSTLQRRLSAIAQAHRAAGHLVPSKLEPAAAVWAGIRRAKGCPPEGKAPTSVRELRAMAEALPEGLLGRRDRALLLIGFAAALRRSELVGLDVQDVTTTPDGLVVHLRRSKTDQEGRGRRVGVPYGSYPATCPVRALQAWLEAASISSGPLFRTVNRHGQVSGLRLSAQAVALVVKRYARVIGLDPAGYAGHSLRAGLATAAAERGVSERSIMAQTGHRSVIIARRYIREGSLFRDNAAAAVGL